MYAITTSTQRNWRSGFVAPVQNSFDYVTAAAVSTMSALCAMCIYMCMAVIEISGTFWGFN